MDVSKQSQWGNPGGKKMAISKAHRILLINQYKILGLLDEENKDYYDNLVEIYEWGYTKLYLEAQDLIYEELSDDAQIFVWDVLGMYDLINVHMEENPSECEKIKSHDHSAFGGFNGNNETDMMGFAQYLVEREGYYDSIKNARKQKGLPSFNTHCPMSQKYRAMLDQFEKIKGKGDWTEKEVLQVLDASPSQ